MKKNTWIFGMIFSTVFLFAEMARCETLSFPNCNFVPSGVYGLVPYTVRFQKESKVVLVSNYWDFDDDSVASTARNPIHTFERQGGYEVSLVATKRGKSSLCNEVIIATLVAPDFEIIGATSGKAPLSVMFMNITKVSDGVVLDYDTFPPEWDFGDGGMSSEINPAHTYTNDGVYDVKLSIIHDGWSYYLLKKKAITVDKGVASFASGEAEEEIAVGDGDSRTIRLRK